MKEIKSKIIPLSLCVSIILSSQVFASEKTLLEEVKVSEDTNYYIENGL